MRERRLIPRGEPGDLVSDPALAAAQARRLLAEGAVDTICVHGDTPGAVAIARAVAAVMERPGRTGGGWVGEPLIGDRAWTVPVVYEAHGVAERLGLAPERLAAEHAACTWSVVELGFQPGFAYLESPDWRFEVPREPAPRMVEAGLLAVAGRRSGIYPGRGPGGWPGIGRVRGFPLLTPEGARLRVGDTLRFRPVAP
jgi:hypothetical protein